MKELTFREFAYGLANFCEKESTQLWVF